MTKVWMDGINGPVMDKFMADLRSGEYKQTVGVLEGIAPRDGMCCLGVATSTNAEACGLVRNEKRWTDRVTFYLDSDPVGFTALMPVVVMDHLGIPKEYRIAEDHDVEGSIYVVMHEGEEVYTSVQRSVDGRPVIDVISLNDAAGRSFAAIADRFEETFMVEVKG